MSSAAQVLANQANAQHSTGPTTEEGKARVAANRLTHGLAGSEFRLLPWESPEQFTEFGPIDAASATPGLASILCRRKARSGPAGCRGSSKALSGAGSGMPSWLLQRTESSSVVAEIEAFDPDVLILGMGMPLQEHWTVDNLANLGQRAILMSGGMMNYVAGVVPSPPRWPGRLGVEWLCRLAVEPRRLAYRYLIEPWQLVIIIIAHYARRRPNIR